jgi:hypothetical protein
LDVENQQIRPFGFEPAQTGKPVSCARYDESFLGQRGRKNARWSCVVVHQQDALACRLLESLRG